MDDCLLDGDSTVDGDPESPGEESLDELLQSMDDCLLDVDVTVDGDPADQPATASPR
jgi:hypothetical protein